MIKIQLTNEFLEWLAEQLQTDDLEAANEFAVEFINALSIFGGLDYTDTPLSTENTRSMIPYGEWKAKRGIVV